MRKSALIVSVHSCFCLCTQCVTGVSCTVLTWMVVGGSGVIVDCVRLDRWRREYELSIKRLFLSLKRK